MQPAESLFTRQLPGDRFRDQTDPVLQLENINVSFDGFKALTDLSLNIGVGELRCVILSRYRSRSQLLGPRGRSAGSIFRH
jgi:urea transport system ATP-binding protein